jgi:hypothetical protein
MTQQTITVRIDGFFYPDDAEILADVEGGYGIHPSISDEDLWTVTHIKTGLACGTNAKSYERAVQVRSILMQMDFGGVPFADLPLCEAATIAPSVAMRLGDAIGVDPELMYESAMNSSARRLCEGAA